MTDTIGRERLQELIAKLQGDLDDAKDDHEPTDWKVVWLEVGADELERILAALRELQRLREQVRVQEWPRCNCKAGVYDTHDEGCPLAAAQDESHE